MGSRQSQNTESASLFVLGYHWLPLATINLVGDNRELGSLRHILRSYTHYGRLVISEH